MKMYMFVWMNKINSMLIYPFFLIAHFYLSTIYMRLNTDRFIYQLYPEYNIEIINLIFPKKEDTPCNLTLKKIFSKNFHFISYQIQYRE